MSHHKILSILIAANLSARLLAQSCSLDITFNPGSGADYYVYGPSIGIYGLAMETNGQILISGQFNKINGQLKNYVARLNSDGSLDSSFDCYIGPDNAVWAVACTLDGKCFIGGAFSTVNSIGRKCFGRLRADGSLDTSFGDMGFNGYVRKIAPLKDGGCLLFGDFSKVKGLDRNKIARLTFDGQTDSLFDPASSVSGGQIIGYAVQPNGLVILYGNFTQVAAEDRRLIVRVSQDGTPDENFNTEYIYGSIITKVVLQADGKMIIFGDFQDINGYSWNGIARLNSNGALDKTFPLRSANGNVEEYCYQANGKCILSGTFSINSGGINRGNLVRLNSDGSLDADFNPNPNAGVHNVLIQPDGKLLVAGDFTKIANTNINRIARLNIDGSVPVTPIFLNPRLFLGSLFMGDIGAKYRIEFTTNLTSLSLWTPLTNFIIQSSSVLFVDPSEIGTDPNRFYRAVFLP